MTGARELQHGRASVNLDSRVYGRAVDLTAHPHLIVCRYSGAYIPKEIEAVDVKPGVEAKCAPGCKEVWATYEKCAARIEEKVRTLPACRPMPAHVRLLPMAGVLRSRSSAACTLVSASQASCDRCAEEVTDMHDCHSGRAVGSARGTTWIISSASISAQPSPSSRTSSDVNAVGVGALIVTACWGRADLHARATKA